MILNTYSYAVYYVSEFDLIPTDQVERYFLCFIQTVVPTFIVSKIRRWTDIIDSAVYEIHNDSDTPNEKGIQHTFLLYCNDIDQNDGRLLEIGGDIIRPSKGKIVHMQNNFPCTSHRVLFDELTEKLPREVIKITGY